MVCSISLVSERVCDVSVIATVMSGDGGDENRGETGPENRGDGPTGIDGDGSAERETEALV